MFQFIWIDVSIPMLKKHSKSPSIQTIYLKFLSNIVCNLFRFLSTHGLFTLFYCSCYSFSDIHFPQFSLECKHAFHTITWSIFSFLFLSVALILFFSLSGKFYFFSYSSHQISPLLILQSFFVSSFDNLNIWLELFLSFFNFQSALLFLLLLFSRLLLYQLLFIDSLIFFIHMIWRFFGNFYFSEKRDKELFKLLCWS